MAILRKDSLRVEEVTGVILVLCIVMFQPPVVPIRRLSSQPADGDVWIASPSGEVAKKGAHRLRRLGRNSFPHGGNTQSIKDFFDEKTENIINNMEGAVQQKSAAFRAGGMPSEQSIRSTQASSAYPSAVNENFLEVKADSCCLVSAVAIRKSSSSPDDCRPSA